MHDFTNHKPTTGNAIWALVLAIVAALVWTLVGLPAEIHEVAPLMQNGRASEAYGNIIGHGIFQAAVVWAIAYLVIFRHRAPGRGFLYFIILLVVVIGADVGAVMFVKSAAENNDREMKNAIAEMQASLGALNESSSPADVNVTVTAQGDVGVLESATKQFVVLLLTDRKNYLDELKALGYPDFLEARTYTSDDELAAARQKLKLARKITSKYAELNGWRITEMRATLQKLPIGDTTKRQVIVGYDDAIAQDGAMRVRMWQLQDSIFAEHEQIASLLAHSEGNWHVRGKTIIFDNDADLSSYNAHIHNLATIRNEMKSLQSNARQSLNGRISK